MGFAASNLVVIGLDQSAAPVEVRERVAVPSGHLATVLELIRPHASSVVVLSTCNRSELYLFAPRVEPSWIFRKYLGDPGPALWQISGWPAAQHLFRVAGGLESQVLGEAQILAQVRQALETARLAGTAGLELGAIFNGALRAGKQVRSLTGLGQGAVSLASVAVRQAEAAVGDLSGARVLVLGAGDMARLVLTHLAASGVKNIEVINRTKAHAEALAQGFGGKVCATHDLEAALARADIVIASASAPHPLVRRSWLEAHERLRPLFLIDLGLPRNVEPDVGGLPGVYLYNLDDLRGVAQTNLSTRSAAIPEAEAVIEQELVRVWDWLWDHERRRRVAARAGSLERQGQAELAASLRGKLSGLSPEQVAEVERLLHLAHVRAVHPLFESNPEPEQPEAIRVDEAASV